MPFSACVRSVFDYLLNRSLLTDTSTRFPSYFCSSGLECVSNDRNHRILMFGLPSHEQRLCAFSGAPSFCYEEGTAHVSFLLHDSAPSFAFNAYISISHVLLSPRILSYCDTLSRCNTQQTEARLCVQEPMGGAHHVHWKLVRRRRLENLHQIFPLILKRGP